MVTPANWNFMNGQLTPTSESSCSSIGSGPPSPFDSSTPLSNVLLQLESEANYIELSLIDQAWYHPSSEPLEPSHTFSQDTFLFPLFQQNYNSNSKFMPTSDYSHSGRPSDIYDDELYSFTFTSAPLHQSTVFSRSPLGGQARDQKIAFRERYPQRSNMSNFTDCSSQFPSTRSMESSSSEYELDNSDMKKPSESNANGGTYTCTYHGCTLRFETPAKLQKHKRKVHRQSAPLADGSASSAVASQAGPHRCKRINPSTKKQCNITFSRPYDLTRHEDTIHNPKKKKVCCPLCEEEKTFSRTDALNRHLKVTHPSYNRPANSRRGQHPPKLDNAEDE